MKLLVERDVLTDKSTLGLLYIEGSFYCFTLEDKLREHKIPGETCIPIGSYKIVKHYSPRFGAHYPMLMDVPNFSGVLIHAGNTPEDTEGCILVGRRRMADRVLESRAVFSPLREKIFAAIDLGDKVIIHIVLSPNLLDFRTSKV